MRSHAFVFLCLVIGARAASINPPEENKLDALHDVEVELKEPIEQPISEVGNNFRNAEIPVSIVDGQQLKNIDENSNDYVPDINDNTVQRRVELDLKNPGPPQRQEHETQNPGHYSDNERALISVKEKIEETQQIFTEQLKSLSTNFDALIEKNENLPILQQRIRNLNFTFSEKVAELSETVKSYIDPSSKDLKSDIKRINIFSKEIQNIQSNLRKVQINFENGINALSEGVQLLATTKEEEEPLAIKGKDDSGAWKANNEPTQTPTVTQHQSTWAQSFTNMQTSVLNNLSTLFSSVQSFFGQGQQSSTSQAGATSVLADAPQQQTQQPQQPLQQPQPFRPIANLVQFFQNSVASLTNQTPQVVAPAAQAVPSNSVPAQPGASVPPAEQIQPLSTDPQNVSQPAQPQTVQTQSQPAQPQPEAPPVQTRPGPIQQLLQNNAIIRGVQSAIQRVQPTTANPSKPREKSEKPQEDRKGGYYGGNYNNKGDNNDSNGLVDEPAQVEHLGKVADVQEVMEEQEIIDVPSSEVKRLITSSKK